MHTHTIPRVGRAAYTRHTRIRAHAHTRTHTRTHTHALHLGQTQHDTSNTWVILIRFLVSAPLPVHIVFYRVLSEVWLEFMAFFGRKVVNTRHCPTDEHECCTHFVSLILAGAEASRKPQAAGPQLHGKVKRTGIVGRALPRREPTKICGSSQPQHRRWSSLTKQESRMRGSCCLRLPRPFGVIPARFPASPIKTSPKKVADNFLEVFEPTTTASTTRRRPAPPSSPGDQPTDRPLHSASRQRQHPVACGARRERHATRGRISKKKSEKREDQNEKGGRGACLFADSNNSNEDKRDEKIVELRTR